jgi:hypothetical protein
MPLSGGCNTPEKLGVDDGIPWNLSGDKRPDHGLSVRNESIGCVERNAFADALIGKGDPEVGR